MRVDQPTRLSDRIFLRKGKDSVQPARPKGRQAAEFTIYYERAKRASRARAILQCRWLGRLRARRRPKSFWVRNPVGRMMIGTIIIVAAVLLLLIGAAKRRRGRKQRAQKLVFSSSLALLTLATNDVVGGLLSDTVVDRVWLSSMDIRSAIRDITVGEGPIVYGVAHGDYTDAEVEECLEAVGSWDRSDQVAVEQANRKVRTIGTFSGFTPEEVLNNGNPKRVRLGFMLEDGQTLRFWAWNKSGVNPLTTGAVIEGNGQVYAYAR